MVSLADFLGMAPLWICHCDARWDLGAAQRIYRSFSQVVDCFASDSVLASYRAFAIADAGDTASQFLEQASAVQRFAACHSESGVAFVLQRHRIHSDGDWHVLSHVSTGE